MEGLRLRTSGGETGLVLMGRVMFAVLPLVFFASRGRIDCIRGGAKPMDSLALGLVAPDCNGHNNNVETLDSGTPKLSSNPTAKLPTF